MIIPNKGAKTINKITINTPEGRSSPALAALYQLTILNPACAGSVTPEKPCAIAAPAKPPMSVCEDEEGIPFHHVNKFQMIAETIPAKITMRLMLLVCAVLATVSATPKPKTQ